MANNTKLERISVELAGRLNDKVTAGGVVITTGDQDGVILSAAQRMLFINRAMFKLFNEVWMGANQKDSKNAKQIFVGVFPELVVTRDLTTLSATSTYDIATPNLDYFQLLEATINPAGASAMQAEFLPSYLYLTAKYGRTTQIKGTTSIPMIVEANGTIYFLPDDVAFQSKPAKLTFIRQPLDKTQGCFLSMTNGSSGGNTEDSPFGNQWNTAIVDRAEILFRMDAKE